MLIPTHWKLSAKKSNASPSQSRFPEAWGNSLTFERIKARWRARWRRDGLEPATYYKRGTLSAEIVRSLAQKEHQQSLESVVVPLAQI